MGKQSSIISYKGAAHKDIYYDGKYHNKMYIGDELVWEKQIPDSFFVVNNCNGYGSYGLPIFEKETPYVDVIPFSDFDYVENNVVYLIQEHFFNSCMNNIILHDCIYTTDGEEWKSVEGIYYTTYYTSVVTPGNYQATLVKKQTGSSITSFYEYYVALFDVDGNHISMNSLGVNSRGDTPGTVNSDYPLINVPGFGGQSAGTQTYGNFVFIDTSITTYVKFIHYSCLDSSSFTVTRNFQRQDFYYVCGERLYFLENGTRDLYIKMFDETNSNPDLCYIAMTIESFSCGFAQVIYTSTSKLVIAIVDEGNQSIVICTLTEDSCAISNRLEDGIMYIEDYETKESMPVTFYSGVASKNEKKFSALYPTTQNGSCSFLQKEDGKLINKENGDMAVLMSKWGSGGEKYIVYFDNEDFTESNGNFTMRFENLG
ncbi:MAG: hypothetical protein LUI12_01720 [Clostridiales bacterium]|nr:hypothetical protein [Clostridiales bacterium]